jgi:tetratricopeptide (TPR) repeat protein
MSAVNDPTPNGPTQPTSPGGNAIQAAAPSGGATAIQTAPAPETPPVPLPPRPRSAPLSPEELARATARLDRMLVGLVLIFTFLVALFPVRNSDFWLHLATARDWLAGKMALGDDPYTYTGNGYWVNHSWLYEVLVYGLFRMVGGPAAIVVKALLLTGLSVLMLSIRRRGQSVWIPGVCTALAVLVMSPGFLMQPLVVSFVLLGVTAALLLRRELHEEPAETGRRRPYTPVPWLGEPADRHLWLLPPLFALWVNLDAWFFVGPLAVALYLLGSLLNVFFARNTDEAPRPGAWRPLAAVLGAGIVACLLNPFGVNALTLPGEWGAAAAQLRQDDLFAVLLSSPLQGEYFRPEMGLTAAGLAYFVLIVVAAAAAYLNTSATGKYHWGRMLLWIGFLVLSLGQARAIPFFAVVAGPIAALNFQEYAVRRLGPAPATTGWLREWLLLGRGLSVLGALALAALAWPGWLFGFPNEDRRVRLEAEPPAGMVKLAKQLEEWHQDGTLQDEDRGLNLEPQAADVLAWLCTEHREKCFFDDRFGNFSPEVAGDLVKVRQTFEPPKAGEPAEPLGKKWNDCKTILSQRKITYLIASDPRWGNFQVSRRRMIDASPVLVTLYQDGHTMVCAMREKELVPRENPYLRWVRDRLRPFTLPPLPPPREDTGRFKDRAFDPWASAFGPKAEPLPDQSPRRPQPLAWWMRFAYGPGPQAADTGDAATVLAYFEETAFRHHYEHFMIARSAPSFGRIAAASAIHTGNAMADAAILYANSRFSLMLERPPIDFDSLGPVLIGPTSPVVLGIRSARRAILHNPDDAAAYHNLGYGYLLLSRQSEERQVALARNFTLLNQLRNAQGMAALRKAVLLNPDDFPSQYHFSYMAGRSGFWDVELKHRNEALRALRRRGPRPGETDKQFQEFFDDLDRQREELEKQVSDNQNTYEIRASGRPVWEKVRHALGLGLGDKALQLLLDSTAVEFGDEGARAELDLLLGMGRLEELRHLLDPPNDSKTRDELNTDLNKKLGPGTYERYRFLLAAAEGNYKEADEFLEKTQKILLEDDALQRTFRRQLMLEADKPGPAKELSLRRLLAVSVAQMIADSSDFEPGPGPVAWVLMRRKMQFVDRFGVMDEIAKPVRLAADYEMLRGLLKIESGHIAEAQEHLSQALFDKKDEKTSNKRSPFVFTGMPIAYRYLQLIEQREK